MGNPQWKDEIGAMNNQETTFLNRGTDSSKDGFGWAPSYWKTKVGAVLLVREDGQDLELWRAQALCGFCSEVLQPKFEDSLQPPEHARYGITVRTREEAVSFMTPEKFEDYSKKYKPEQGDLEAGLQNIRLGSD